MPRRSGLRPHHSRARRPTRYVLGLMAGTSGDGIDAACARIVGSGPDMHAQLVLHHHTTFTPPLRRRLAAAMAPAQTTTQEIARLHADLGLAFARAAKTAIDKLPSRKKPTLVGLAGQTVCHLPSTRPGKTVTLQLGDPARVAAHTHLPVVADFRQSDVAAGGQGAPLVPWTDWVLFRHPRFSRVVLNIGGIANLTFLPPGARPQDVIAFDTGPGNMIIDALVNLTTRGRQTMDRDGRRAARGRILPQVLESWLKHPFLARRPPKTTGREEFGAPFLHKELPALKRASRDPDDWIATATAFTASAVAHACRNLLTPRTFQAGLSPKMIARGKKHYRDSCEIIVCGGGAKNPVLTAFLAARLPGATVRAIDDLGLPAQAKEALSFAMLAAAHLDHTPANLPPVTGAARPAVLGHLSLPL